MTPETILIDFESRLYVMVGSGGHARVLQEVLALQGIALHGFIAPNSTSRLADIPWLGTDTDLPQLDSAQIVLVNGVGSVSAPLLRRSVFEKAIQEGFAFASVVDANASIRASCTLAAGVQVLSGAILGSDVTIGEDSIVNSGAIVEHGTRVGAHTHISPGATIAGEVQIGDCSHIGLGATVIQGVSIGSHCTIGAGAVVIHDVEDGFLAVGVPAVARRKA
jgi:UDP-perosamine 4-acetyltransferase